MKFIATETQTKCLTKGKIYYGAFVHINSPNHTHGRILQIIVFDDSQTWREFNPTYFEPYEE